MTAVQQLPLDRIDDGTNVRRKVDAALRASMAEHGLLQPITVARVAGRRYRVLYGHRRTAAARALGWETIPAIVSEAGDHLPITQVVENLDRRGLNPMEIAEALQASLDADPDLTRTDLARMLGRKLPWVSAKLALLRLPDDVQQRIRAGELNDSVAIRQRARLNDGRGHPRVISEPDEAGRSKSINVEIRGSYRGAGADRQGLFSIGVDHGERSVDLVVEQGDRRVFLTLSPEEAKLLGRRLTQAWEAVA
jgi:ParB/RepB/Spo0J family partition protein